MPPPRGRKSPPGGAGVVQQLEKEKGENRMWLYGGYYYRGMVYRGPQGIAALGAHLKIPCMPPAGAVSELDWLPAMQHIENNAPHKKTNEYSGEDWPQVIGTWDAILYPHIACGPDIPEPDDYRRRLGVCACLYTADNTQSPDCDLPNYRRPLR